MLWHRLLSGVLLLAGCATPPPATPPRAVLWPMPPEQPRYIHEGTLRSVANVMPDNDTTRLRRLLTGPGAETEEVLAKPMAVAARGGRVFVTDTVKRRVVVFDNPRRKVFEFGLRPPGELVKPQGIALDAQRHVYVADAGRRQVVVYDDLGLYSHTVGNGDLLEHPTGVATNADGSRIYVVDRGSNESSKHRIQMFDATGRHIRQIGMRGDAPGQFNIPVQAAVGPDGRLYVLDAGNFRVQVFSAEGDYLHAFGQAGTALGQIGRAHV
jgi:DNA-binding beta-propeller fold protein YncE